MKQEFKVLKDENSELRKQVQENNNIKMENQQLKPQLKVQEEDTVKAMKDIENQIELETKKVIKLDEDKPESVADNNKKEIQIIEKQYQKKLLELKQEKDKIMEEMVKLQTENDLETEKNKASKKLENMKRISCCLMS